jgi:NAD(P)-dependent dehydrogenase (short-subunit alcohol dehydrogenase family)
MPRNTGNDRCVWLVTGASRGFGKAISEAVLARGDKLVATARGSDFADSFGRDHPAALALHLDVTDPAEARAAIEEAVGRFGRLDVVVNNAGYGHFGAVEELTDEELRRQLEVNFFGVVNVTRAALPQLRRQRSGHIVQMSSLNGIEGMVGGGYYCASKFAIEGLSESLANEAFADFDGAQPGDPDRAAAAIIEAVETDDPPLRLPLGQMALENIRAKLELQLEELERWSALAQTELVAA